MAKPKTASKPDLSGIKAPKVIIPIVNPYRWKALRVLLLIKQLEAIAANDPTKVNIKEFLNLLDVYVDLNEKYHKEKRERRNVRDRKAASVKQGVDADGLATDNGSVPPSGTGENGLPSVDLRVPPKNKVAW